MTAGVTELLTALVELRDRFDADSAAVSYVSPAGVLVTMTVYRSFGTLTDDAGHVQAISLEGATR